MARSDHGGLPAGRAAACSAGASAAGSGAPRAGSTAGGRLMWGRTRAVRRVVEQRRGAPGGGGRKSSICKVRPCRGGGSAGESWGGGD
jgi:hypothetical protein